MTTQLTESYEFDRLGIEPIAAGTNLLVAGPPLGGAREMLFELLADGGDDEGLVFISADTDGENIVETYQATGTTFDPRRMCVIDCTQASQGESNGPIRRVGSPSDLTGIGIQFSSLYESLHGSGLSYIRTGLSSISTLLVYADDLRAVYRFLHTITSRIRTADGLGVFTIDPDAVETEAFATVAQAFDARIDVREGDDSPEFRIQGLPDQPDGWQSL